MKAQVIASARNAVVEEKLTPIDTSMFAHFAPPGTSLATLRGDRTDLEKWQNDPTSRPTIEKKLADKGHDEPSILAEAYIQAAASIDAIDQRIASYELRRMAALREVAAYSAKLAGQLKAASEAVIEGGYRSSSRRIRAASCNAQKSTGPRSKLGRQKSSRNALRHGLQ